MSGEKPRRPGMVRVGPGELYGSSPAAAGRLSGWRRDGFRRAFELAQEAQSAGLVVMVMAPMLHSPGEFQVRLCGPDGALWAEGANEDAEMVRTHVAGWLKRSPRPAAKLAPHEDGPQDRDEAISMLAHYALSTLWSESDFQPDGMGCCHVCCAPCASLYYLERMGLLDVTVRGWPEGMAGSDMFVDDRVDRAWMFRQWTGSRVQEQCGHRLAPPAAGWTDDGLPREAGWPGRGIG